jgi:2-iminobutanoate/2-iminopropanoate deaminase
VAIDTKTVPWPGGAYSLAIRWRPFLLTAGMGPHDPETGKVMGTTIEEHTVPIMRNMAALLATQGLTFDHVLKTTVHLTDLPGDFRGFDRTYREFVSPPYPARCRYGTERRRGGNCLSIGVRGGQEFRQIATLTSGRRQTSLGWVPQRFPASTR